MIGNSLPIELYFPPESHGAIPNLLWRQSIDPNIQQKLRIHQNYQGCLQNLSRGSVICLSINFGSTSSLQSIPDLVKNGSRIIIHVGEPTKDFDEQLPLLDQDGVSIILTGAANYVFRHARVFRKETFFGELTQLYKNFPDELQPENLRSKTFYFDALLGTAHRLPRSWIKHQLESRYPGKNIIRTYPSRYPYLFRHVAEEDYLWPNGVDWSGQEDQNFFAAAMVRYHGRPAMVCLIIPWNIYEQTAYSIVAETHVENSWNFYTEKTAKPILARRLFVAFAGQYHLRNLRLLGFKTFDGIIDESYDLEPDPELRWAMAMEQVEYLHSQDQIQILTQIQDIVEHNFQVLWTTDWVHQANELIIDLALGKN